MEGEKSSKKGIVIEEIAERIALSNTARRFPVSVHQRTSELIERSLRAIFPHFAEGADYGRGEVIEDLKYVQEEINDLLSQLSVTEGSLPEQENIGEQFVQSFPEIRRRLMLDAIAIFDGDPAGQSVDEVILAYPGFMATAFYRMAHRLWELRIPLIPRLVSNIGHGRTGIDIHPAAIIGRDFCIDHGTGIVIGETAVIGNGVKLYQGVTLGAVSVQKGLASTKRHPTIGDNVVIYANATILGGDTVIGHDCVVSGNAFITQSVPPFSFVSRSGKHLPRRPGQQSDLEYYI